VVAPRSGEARMLWYIAAGTVPIGVAGIALKPYITGELRELWVVAAALIVVGVIMGVVDRADPGKRTIAELGLRDALIVGLAQACALVPGVSRSGATITCALLLGFARPDAARWSFLLSVPAIGAAGIFEMKDAFRELGGQGLPALALATVAAAVASYASIAWLLRFLRTRSLLGFAVYRVLLGGLLIALILVG
jgi:undecaprenyl-diphosphatase